MSAAAILDALMRTHDDDPDAAIEQLPALLAAPGLSASERSRAAWLANHLLGEKRGDWRRAWSLLKALPEAGANPAQLRHCAVAATLAGDALAAWRLERQSLACGSSADGVRLAIRLGVLQGALGAAPLRDALSEFAVLQAGLELEEAGEPDAALAALVNNIVSALLEKDELDIRDPFCEGTLLRGARIARLLWERAGSWVNRERAEYLLALAANRFERWRDGLQAADAGLALIADNGEEEVDRAFLLLERARALSGLDRRAEAEEAHAAARALAASFDADLKRWFDDCARRAKKEPAGAGS
ncbi:hypothetical protein [Chromobacterium violaceum]|uniref:hypothetical protein n=1 Tax=Chromobacterium violaceum TaxID=536 RepID=UPI001C8BF567|nr:hypothetical protein [Chromobacterium violaceum]MBX9266606.1 hypothetical protein [Chromobacterium violaceum]